MEFLVEFLISFAFEGAIEIAGEEKIPKFIRYPIAAVVALLFAAVVCLVFFAGFLAFCENTALGVLIISIGLFMFTTITSRIVKSVKRRRNKK